MAGERMENIIQKYFSDPPSDYTGQNVFNPPANRETIISVEKELDVNFPPDYKAFLLLTNGYDGTLGQSYVQLVSIEQTISYTTMYGGEFFPWIIYLGSDGGNEMFVLDKRDSQLQFGLMPFIGEEEDFIPLGKTFEEFARHLYQNDFWDNGSH